MKDFSFLEWLLLLTKLWYAVSVAAAAAVLLAGKVVTSSKKLV